MESGFPGPGRRAHLLGRAGECALLDDMLSAIRRGEGRSLVLLGEAGIGKTALLEYLIGSASDVTVLRAVGVESEMELAYASLHQLCGPLLDRLWTLPPPQRRALEVVFGLSDGDAPDRFLVGLAVLGLVSEASGDRPLLCVIDDAQWLDQASALSLAFVARRLRADPVGLLFAAREPGELQRVAELEVKGLGKGDARALLSSAVMFKLDEQVRERIVAETRGNPLALLELPQGLTATQLAGGLGLMGARDLSGRIEDSFVRRLDRLSEDARCLLLLAAAEPLGDPLLLSRAAGALGIGAAASAEATDGLLSISQRVTFRHPLVRSAVYRSATAERRRVVHLALAGATDRDTDPDRRAWHLAAAAVGPDEQVASELARSASRAQARGGLAAAAAYLERSVSLSADLARRSERALAAAQASLSAGAFDAVQALLIVAEAGPLDELQHARVELLRAQLAFVSGHGSDAPPLLLRAAKRLEPLDVDLARDTYLNALSALMVTGRSISRDAGVIDVARAARAAPPPRRSPRGLDLMLDGLATLYVEGRAPAVPILVEALRVLADDTAAEEDLRWLSLAGVVAVQLWDDETWHALRERYVELGRQAGALGEIPLALNARIYVHLFSGELDTAASLIDELRNVTEATGSFLGPGCALHLAAMRGSEPDLFALIDDSHDEMIRRGQGGVTVLSDVAKAVLYNGLGRYDEAFAAVTDAGPEDLTAENWAIAERIEAAARTGRPESAADGVLRLQEITRDGGTDWGLGLAARCRALVSEGDSAESLYQEAIERLARTRMRPELARAHLLCGEWLRRDRRRVDAREHLRVAHEMFTTMGMDAFAERAGKELLATGERARKRTMATRDDLTAQERQIAQLARDGLSNPDIGARLFLSSKTVEWHLHKVFGKLGIRSRHELANALQGSAAKLVES
ncbi:MAG TPA: LuxR family transcriptional regulator [Solirubrobacteraceae bacterium]|nr:LuxR family transcriptional regulator [Solirubrobacteraceae bacterium]